MLGRNTTRIQARRPPSFLVPQTFFGLILQREAREETEDCVARVDLVWELVQVGVQQIVAARLRHPQLVHSVLKIVYCLLLLPQAGQLGLNCISWIQRSLKWDQSTSTQSHLVLLWSSSVFVLSLCISPSPPAKSCKWVTWRTSVYI